MIYKAWCCLGEVPYWFSRSSVKFQGHRAKKIVHFDPNGAFPDCNSSLNSTMALKWCTKLGVASNRCPIIFSWDQSALWMVLSVRHTFFTMLLSSYHHEIVRSYYHRQKWCPCKRSRSEVKGQGHRGQNLICPFLDCSSIWNSPMARKWCIKLEWS